MPEPFNLIRVCDVETTGLDDPAEMVEIGWTDVRLFPTGWQIESGPESAIVNPGMPISFPAMAVHHITETMAGGVWTLLTPVRLSFAEPTTSAPTMSSSIAASSRLKACPGYARSRRRAPPGPNERIDPISELAEKVHPDKIITVGIGK
ncbi:hypothetical protein [Mesorhizobium sp. B2-4-6]|uniref:hypothetical protein n=1 Tax=Mesorhizobium sp. B2-4-6 TaxID=2589943 RepID=UPI001127BDB9|nr:hypothetical protein [Mesorhizobium sp. B2-4-6]TPL40642.1 hypothetical protein FJ957_25770 [Mesorhizobium sp. B2-4-6]